MYVHFILTPQYHFVLGTLLHRCYFKELSTIGSNKFNYISCINFIDLIVEMNKKYSIEEVIDFVTLPDGCESELSEIDESDDEDELLINRDDSIKVPEKPPLEIESLDDSDDDLPLAAIRAEQQPNGDKKKKKDKYK